VAASPTSTTEAQRRNPKIDWSGPEKSSCQKFRNGFLGWGGFTRFVVGHKSLGEDRFCGRRVFLLTALAQKSSIRRKNKKVPRRMTDFAI
jgi:hypothetical protein